MLKYLQDQLEKVDMFILDDLSTFDVPVKLIFGEEDTITPPSLGVFMKKNVTVLLILLLLLSMREQNKE